MKTHQHKITPFAKKTPAWRMFVVFFLYIVAAPASTIAATKPANAVLNNSPVIRLEIHHININNGDASAIRLVHKDGTETKVLIDGGDPKPTDNLLPYIQGMFKDAQFQYIVLTHYHKDHYNGLTALANGTLKSEYYIDLGGYNMRGAVSQGNLALIQPQDTICPWTGSDGVFDGTMGAYALGIGAAVDHYGLKRYMPISKDNDHIQDMVGVVIPLGNFERNSVSVPINLRCVAAWGFTQGNGAVIDNWKKGASKNDPTLGFVLECGEFRYFFGGDMGGDASSSYIDQETTLSEGFAFLYKNSVSYFKPGTAYNGHVCGFKANHHGSDKSNNDVFLTNMHPSICVTSAGDHSGWHLPSVGFIDRLSTTTPITLPTDIPTTESPTVSAQAFLFTNLYNFGGNNDSLDEADNLFGHRERTTYSYGTSGTQEYKRGFEVIVYLNIPDVDMTKVSAYQTLGVLDNFQTTGGEVVFCHKTL